MPTECKGFTLVEVLVAAVIFFMAMAVISTVFSSSSQRLFKLKKQERQLKAIAQAMPSGEIEEDTQDVNVKVTYREDNEDKTLIYEAEAKFIKFSECSECPELVSEIRISSEAEK